MSRRRCIVSWWDVESAINVDWMVRHKLGTFEASFVLLSLGSDGPIVRIAASDACDASGPSARSQEPPTHPQSSHCIEEAGEEEEVVGGEREGETPNQTRL